MSIQKNLITSLVALGLSSITIASFAASDLVIDNQTAKDSTSVINGVSCSNIFDGGVTKAHSKNVVKSSILKFACIINPSNCTAAVYMTANCTGPLIATITFDVNNGIKNISPGPGYPGYIIQGSGFNISVRNS